MKFFTVACTCGEPLISYDDYGEYIKVFRTRTDAELELSETVEISEVSIHRGHEGVRVIECNAHELI